MVVGEVIRALSQGGTVKSKVGRMCRLSKQVTVRQFRLVALRTRPGEKGGGQRKG